MNLVDHLLLERGIFGLAQAGDHGGEIGEARQHLDHRIDVDVRTLGRANASEHTHAVLARQAGALPHSALVFGRCIAFEAGAMEHDLGGIGDEGRCFGRGRDDAIHLADHPAREP